MGSHKGANRELLEVYSNLQTGPLPGPPGSYSSGLSAHKFNQIKQLSLLFQQTSTVERRSCVVYAQDNNSLPVWSIFCHQLTNSYLHQFSTIFGGNCIRLTVSSFDSQANQSNQSSIQREILMPSPEVIDLTLSDDEIQPDPIRSDQGTSMPTQATNQFRTSSSTPPTSGINRTRRILPVIQGTFAAIERAENYLPLQPFFNNTHFGQTLINCIHNQHRIGIPDEYFVETCINTYTQNGFVTKEFVKIDEDSHTQDYTIIYIKFQGQTPPFSTHNRDIFERLLPTPFPQVGDILTEEEDSESEQELIA